MVKPIHKWKLKFTCARQRGYIRVLLFSSVNQMRKYYYLHMADKGEKKQKFYGIAQSYGRKRNKFAEILLVKPYVGGGYFAHELQHVIISLIIRYKWYKKFSNYKTDWATDAEEELCEAVERVTRQFFSKFYQYGGEH